MTRCTCLWRRELDERLVVDPTCPSRRHADDETPVPDRSALPTT